MKKLFTVLLFSMLSLLSVPSLAQQEKQWTIPKSAALEVTHVKNHVKVKLPESNITYYVEKELFKEIKEELTENNVEILTKDGVITEIIRESTLPAIFLEKDTKLQIIPLNETAGVKNFTVKSPSQGQFIASEPTVNNLLLQLKKTKVVIHLHPNNWAAGFAPVAEKKE